MRILRLALGILNIIACGSLVGLHYFGWFLESASDAFTWGLPILIAAALALICGIFTLKKTSWRWAVTGFFFAGAGWIYFLILSWLGSWTMS
jgi:phosphatidylserine synthase